MLEITQIVRKSNTANSINTILSRINPILSKNVKLNILICPYESNSIKNILLNCIWASKIKSEIIHLTGDINYLSLFLNANRIITTILDLGEGRKLNIFKKIIYNIFWIYLPILKSERIITISNYIKGCLLKKYPYFANKFKTIYIPNSTIYKFHKKEISNNPLKILHIATSVHNKNTFRMAQALSGLDIVYKIVGVLPKETINLLNYNNTIWELLYNLTEDELYEEYLKADLIVFPSTYEGFGMPIIESQSIGRPILTSFLQPMIEIAGNGAIYIDPYNVKDIRNGILNFMNNKTSIDTLINLGLINSKRFDVNIIVEKYLKCYSNYEK